VTDHKLLEDVHEDFLQNPSQINRFLCNRLDEPLKASRRPAVSSRLCWRRLDDKATLSGRWVNHYSTLSWISEVDTVREVSVSHWVDVVMCVLMSTRKRTNQLQYSVCKCEVESTGKWSNIGVLFNQLHFNLVPKVWGLIQE
jgi:hypothetical protein